MFETVYGINFDGVYFQFVKIENDEVYSSEPINLVEDYRAV